MAKLVCYVANKNIDGPIAEMLGWKASMKEKGMNPRKVASLRGLYDQQAEENGTEPLLPMENPTMADLVAAAQKLMNFRASIREINKAKLAKGVKHIARAYDALRHAYSLHDRKNRINYISSLFSSEVDRLMQQHKVSRQNLVNGYMANNGQFIGGEFSILEGVYNNILELRQNYYAYSKDSEYFFKLAKNCPVETKDADGNKVIAHVNTLNYVGAPTTVEGYSKMVEHRYKEYTKILECWTELMPFVLKDLMAKEGVKLGIKKEYAAVASSDSFGDNDIVAKFDVSESKKDGWMENSDLQSGFGSVGQQVRRILATVPMMQQEPEYKTLTDLDGKPYRKFVGMKFLPVLDDLGNQRFLDPVKTHQELQEFLKGVQDSDDMIARMCKEGKPGQARIPWMQPIVDILISNPLAKTQFFDDFYKNFQPYSVMFEDEENGVRKIKTRVLNKAKNFLRGRYELTISSKGRIPDNCKVWLEPGQMVFDEKTKEVNWQRLAELRHLVLKWTEEKRDKIDNPQTNDIRNQKRYNAEQDTEITVAPLINNSPNASITLNGKTQMVTYEMKRNFLMEVFSSLGFDVTVDTVDQILESGDIYTVRDQLQMLFDATGKSGFVFGMKQERDDFMTVSSSNVTKEKKEEALQRLNDKHIKFVTLYKSASSNSLPVKEHTEKLLEVISKYQEGYRVESRVRYNGNTMYSFVAPSYLGDKLEAIQSYVKENNKKGLLQFLKNEYLSSPYFVDDEYLRTEGKSGRILNRWVRELVDACDENNKTPLMDTVAAVFSYERDLGRDDKKFEEFTTREHALDMLVHYFADEQVGKGYGGKGKNNPKKKLTAMFPVFILGDAGVSKYIRAPRIHSTKVTRFDKKGRELKNAVDFDKTERIEVARVFDEEAQNEVLDAFYDVYLQEKRRMALEEAMALNMYANGKKVEHAKGEFSLLTFLNDERYALPTRRNAETNEIEVDDTKENVKAVIKKYLEDATFGSDELKREGRRSFMQRLEGLGVLDTVESKKGKPYYRYANSIATPENIRDKIRDFYWNTKLATIQQLQIMTIDPSFYHGTKDLQKRYKEVHAPGSKLDITARNMFADMNPDGSYPLFSEDGIERVAYFDDISVNAEETNPEFMEMIIRAYAQPGADVEALIAGGFHRKWIGEENEKERQEALKGALGKNYEIYKEYCKNSLTDGQGYRTLSSYRKVMGMAGKWTRENEEAYKTIMQIRNKHRADDSDITPEEFELIARMMQVLQPIKPYMFTHEKYPVKINKKDEKGNDVIGADGKPVKIDTYQYIPVQHKYAEALIIPELMPKGSKLRDLANWMEDHNVDMVGSTKIAKVGCFGQARLDKVTDKTSLENEMSGAYIHELPYADYRIQTNVPEHINSSQLFGTQIRKLIMAGLSAREDYTRYLEGIEGFEGTVNLSTDNGATNAECHLKGKNLLAFYNSLICANIMDSYDRFEQNAGDIEMLAELLQQSTVGSMREAMDNLFSYVVTGNEEFLIPLFEGGLEHDAAALILSVFRKVVNKQQISGGSAVQVSAFGIDGYEEDGGLRYVSDPDNPANMLYAEIEMPFDKSIVLEIKDAEGNTRKQTVDLPYSKYVRQDGYMIPSGEPIQKEGKDGKVNPQWKKYQSYTYKEVDGKLVPCRFDDPEAKVYKPLIEKDYPDILSILAYRIPTERDYSMINCQIKRFTLKTAGGTLKCPPQGSKIAGFDFDIDKLYFMLREYHKTYNKGKYAEENFSETAKGNIWEAFYDKNPNVKKALENERTKWEATHPDKVKWIPIVRNGVTLGRIRDSKANPSLNSYWEKAKIEERFNINKNEAFLEAAVSEGYEPNVTGESGEKEEKKYETYDFSKTPEENTKAARNNMLISLIQARLADPETVKQRYTPGGFTNARKAARMMRELFYGDLSSVLKGSMMNPEYVDLETLGERQDEDTDPEPNYDPTDPYTMLVYNQQNQIAAKLIGIFANQNTNHAFASSMDVFELAEPISFCGKSGQDLLYKPSQNASQEEIDRLAEKRAEIDLNMAEFLAASVDAVKDPVLNFLNLNTATADAGALLVRLGYTTKEVGLLFNQPVIRKVCEDSFNRGVRVTSAIEDEIDALRTHLTGYNPKDKVQITEQDLVRGIVKERAMIEKGKTQDDFLVAEAKMQMQVLQLFSQVIKASQDVSDFVLNTKFTASNAVSSTFGGLYAQQLRVDSYVDRFPKSDEKKGDLAYRMVVAEGTKETGLLSMPIDNEKGLVSMSKKEYLHKVRFNPFAYEQAMYDTNRKILKLLAKYFPYERPMYKSIREKMNALARYGTLSEEDINDIHSNIPVALLAKQTASLFNGKAQHEGTNMTNREYYREKFASDLADTLAEHYDELKDLAIFKYLYPVSVEEEQENNGGPTLRSETWRIEMQDVGGMDADTKEEIRESWAYLMEVKDNGEFDSVDMATLGRDLFMYCYYQMGFDFSPISFMHLAPTAVKDNIPVPRAESIEPKHWEGDIKPDSEDVYVWTPSLIGGAENASDKYNANLGYTDELTGNSFQLSELKPNNFRALIQEAKSHPELKFKIAMDLSEEEVAEFSGAGDDIPSNIYFSQATPTAGIKSYGRERSYRQFLREILDGTEQELNTDEFAKMWILNHPDNARFVLDTAKGGKRFRDLFFGSKDGKYRGMLKEARGQMDGTRYRSPLSIDISRYDNKLDMKTLSMLVKPNYLPDGSIESYSWVPCIIINGSFYIADSGSDLGFNTTYGPVVNYRKVEPWGGSKTIKYDGNKKRTPQMMYKSSFDAMPQVKEKPKTAPVENKETSAPETPAPESVLKPEPPAERENAAPLMLGGVRQMLEKVIFDELVRQEEAEGKVVNKEALMVRLKAESDQNIIDTVNSIREAHKDGKDTPMKDAEGNQTVGC